MKTFLIKTRLGETTIMKGDFYKTGLYKNSVDFYENTFWGWGGGKKIGFFQCSSALDYITKIKEINVAEK